MIQRFLRYAKFVLLCSDCSDCRKVYYQAGPEYSWAACVVLADTVSKLQCIMFYLTRIGQLVQTSQLSFSVWRPWLAAQSFTRLLTTNFKIRIIFEHHTHAARCKLINVVQAVSVSPRISIIFCHHSVLFTIAELLLLDSMSEWINRIWSFTDKCILHLYLILES